MPRGQLTVRTLLALIVLLGAAVVAAAVTAPWVFTPRVAIFVGPGGSIRTPAPELSLPPGGTDASARDWWLALLPWLLLVVLAVVAALMLWTPVRRRHRERVRHAAAQRDRPAGVASGDAVADELAVAVEAARRQLAEHAVPADAVIAAWVALETIGARRGVPRRSAESPTEFTGSLVGRTAVDAEALEELLGLYHRARFSSHPVTADDVDRAAACLDRILT